MSKQVVSAFILVSVLMFAFVGVSLLPGASASPGAITPIPGAIVCDTAIEKDPKCGPCMCITSCLEKGCPAYCRKPDNPLELC